MKAVVYVEKRKNDETDTVEQLMEELEYVEAAAEENLKKLLERTDDMQELYLEKEEIEDTIKAEEKGLRQICKAYLEASERACKLKEQLGIDEEEIGDEDDYR